MSCHSLSPLFVLLNARKKRLKQVWEFFWHLWEVCGCRVFLFNFLFLWVNLLEKWPRHIFFQLQMRNVWVKEYVFSSMMRILLNYEWEMCGWRVILSLSILIRKLSWKTKLRAKTWNSQVCFVSPCILFARMCLKLVSTLPLKMELFFPTLIVLTWMQTCSSNMLSTIDLLVWEPLKKRKQSCHMHFIFKLLHQCSNWSKEIYMKLDNWDDLNNWYL